MVQMSEQEYETENKKAKTIRNILETLVVIFTIVGIVTAAFNVTLSGFTPILWFVLAFWCIFIIICMEITMIRTFLERKKQN